MVGALAAQSLVGAGGVVYSAEIGGRSSQGISSGQCQFDLVLRVAVCLGSLKHRKAPLKCGNRSLFNNQLCGIVLHTTIASDAAVALCVIRRGGSVTQSGVDMQLFHHPVGGSASAIEPSSLLCVRI